MRLLSLSKFVGLGQKSKDRLPIFKLHRSNGGRYPAFCLALIFISQLCPGAKVYALEQQAQSVAPEHILFKLFADAIDEKIPALDTKDPNSFQSQLEALNAALQDPSSAKPFLLYAKLDRFHDGSFSSLGKLLPTLVPTSKQRPSPNMEFRVIKKLDVSQAMQLTLNQNLQIAIANQVMDAAKWNYAGALGGFAPNAILNLQTNGARRYTTTLPRLPVNTDSTQVSARVEQGLFQGGRVLFSALSSHEILLQQKGLFAGARNDSLNNAVSNYYGILGAQAILNVRMDSAIFCVRQLREFKKLYIAQTIIAARALSISAQRSADYAQICKYMKDNESTLLNTLRTIKQLNRTSSSTLSPAHDRRLTDIERQLLQASSYKQSVEFNSKYLENILRATTANEEYKRDTLKDADVDGALPESTVGAHSLNSPKAILSSRTRYEQLLSICDYWLLTFSAARKNSRFSVNTCRETIAALQQRTDKPSGDAAQLMDGAVTLIDLDETNIQNNIQSEFTAIRNEMQKVILELTPSMPESAKADVREKLLAITGARWNKIIGYCQELESLHANTAVSIARASQVNNLPISAKILVINSLDQMTTVSATSQRLSENLNSIAEAYNAQIQKAKQVTDLLTSLESRILQVRSSLEFGTVADSAIANQIELFSDDLLRSLHSANATDAEIKRSLIVFRTTARNLKFQSALAQSLLSQTAQQIEKARAIESTEAGYAFQVDQWNTQLASDIQDIITQYLLLRTSSVTLATLLNMDQRTCLLSSEDNLACKARDLSYVGFVELTRQTLNNRPELFAADEFRRAALANVGVAASALMPTVTAFGQIASSGTSNRFDTIHMIRNKSFGLEVNYRMANLLLPSMASVAAQGANAVQAYLKFRDQLNVVMKEIHNSYISVQSAKLRVATAMQKSQKATKQLVEADTPENRMKASASNLDVITALRDRNTAMVDVATQMAGYNAAQAQLLRDSGLIYPISNYLTR